MSVWLQPMHAFRFSRHRERPWNLIYISRLRQTIFPQNIIMLGSIFVHFPLYHTYLQNFWRLQLKKEIKKLPFEMKPILCIISISHNSIGANEVYDIWEGLFNLFYMNMLQCSVMEKRPSY